MLGLSIVFTCFSALTIASLFAPRIRAALAAQDAAAWILDLSGLAIQGMLIPLLQAAVVGGLLYVLLPSYSGIVSVPGWTAFLLNFVLIDYLYYWNHRLLHARGFWALHQVHHSARHMNVLIASRNTIWTSFFIVYLWGNGLALFLLKDSSTYLIASALSCGLDLWRHSGFGPRRGAFMDRLLSLFLVTPFQHACHHGGGETVDTNFGANLNLWDKLHGTFAHPQALPETLGLETGLTLGRSLFFPFKPTLRPRMISRPSRPDRSAQDTLDSLEILKT